MNINKNNYEEYFLDYHEGNLPPDKVAEVLLFLEEHPELREEFESFELLQLEPEAISFSAKDRLKKQSSTAVLINENNYEDFLVAAIEKDLNNEELGALNKFLKEQPTYEKEYRLFQHTVLTPEEELVYPNKLELKQIPYLSHRRKPLYYYISAAASIVLIIATFFFVQNFNSTEVVVDNIPVVQEETLNNIVNTTPIIEETTVGEPEETTSVSVPRIQQQPIYTGPIVKHERTLSEENSTARVAEVAPEVLPKDEARVPEIVEATTEEATLPIAPVVVQQVKVKEDYVAFSDFMEVQLKQKVLNQELSKEEQTQLKLRPLDILHISLRSFKKITGKNADLVAKENEKGEVTALNVNAGNFSFYRSKGR